MTEYEFAVEFGFGFEYYTVPGLNEKEARNKLWNEVLTEAQRNNVSSIELVEVYTEN